MIKRCIGTIFNMSVRSSQAGRVNSPFHLCLSALLCGLHQREDAELDRRALRQAHDVGLNSSEAHEAEQGILSVEIPFPAELRQGFAHF